MPKFMWQCGVCRKLHATYIAATQCESAHPKGTKFCEACDGQGRWQYILDKCDDCDGAGVVITKGTGT